jgi:hypothetical protein
LGDTDVTKPDSPRREVLTEFTPSTQCVRLMNDVADGVDGVDAVFRPGEKTIIIFSPNADPAKYREIFGQWSNRVMAAFADLPRGDRERLGGIGATVGGALAQHSSVHRT